MSKEKTMQKEYAVVVSLILFFAIVIVVGATRIFLITTDGLDRVDLNSVDILEEDTNIDLSNYNIRLANTIKSVYGIDVYYGLMAEIDSVNAVAVTDTTVVFNMLKEVNSVLARYPRDIVREIEAKGYELSIYLVDYFATNIEALANRNNIGQMNIYMSNTEDFKRALHHEIYHILDYYIRLETDENIAYINWEKYNPKEFEYTEDINNITSKYVYNGDTGAYFVTLYAKYSEKEDRAETFAEMMTVPEYATFFSEDEPIKGKINVIKNVLYNNFSTVRNEQVLAWE